MYGEDMGRFSIMGIADIRNDNCRFYTSLFD